jgi:predicted transcriptional regulator
LVHEHRDRIYIRKDIILKLTEHGELNQSRLMSYCGLNNVKHKEIVDEMVDKGLIIRVEEPWGAKKIIKYKVSERGRELARQILEPYELLFPRGEIEKQGEGHREAEGASRR